MADNGQARKCAECGIMIGGSSGIDAYKHTVGCLNVPDRGAKYLLAEYGSKQTEHARRVVANLKG